MQQIQSTPRSSRMVDDPATAFLLAKGFNAYGEPLGTKSQSVKAIRTPSGGKTGYRRRRRKGG